MILHIGKQEKGINVKMEICIKPGACFHSPKVADGTISITDVGHFLICYLQKHCDSIDIKIFDHSKIYPAYIYKVYITTDNISCLIESRYVKKYLSAYNPSSRQLIITFKGESTNIIDTLVQLRFLLLNPQLLSLKKDCSINFATNKNERIQWKNIEKKFELKRLEYIKSLSNKTMEVELYAESAWYYSISYHSLHNNIYRPSNRGFIHISDIFDIILRIVSNYSSSIQVLPNNKSWGHIWDININSELVECNIKAKIYSSKKGLLKVFSPNRLCSLNISGNADFITHVVKEICNYSYYVPYEFNRWDKITQLLGKSKEEIQAPWISILEGTSPIEHFG